MTYRLLDLFSGIGGFSLGLERSGYFETVAFCEIEPFCQQVLAKHWPNVPLYGDVKNLTAEVLSRDAITVDAICGGYPCQPFSAAGRRKGAEDDRHLWPEVSRLVSELRPSVCFFENVAGHVSLGLDDVLSDLEGQGYAAQTFIIPACGVGAPHRRDRVWIVANRHNGQRLPADDQLCAGRYSSDKSCYVPDAASVYAQGKQSSDADAEVGAISRKRPPRSQGDGARWRQSQSRLGRGFDGIPSWLDGSWEAGIHRTTTRKDNRANRLKALGNGVVPQIPEILGRAWGEAMRESEAS